MPAAFHGAEPVTQLKVAEIDLFCAGVHSPEGPGDDEVIAMDTRAGVYRKLVLRDDRLVGAILLGDTSASGRLAGCSRAGSPCPPI